MSPSILVVGGAGFIGSSLVRHLVDDQGHEIRVLDDLSTGRRGNLDGVAGVEFVRGSILDRKTLSKALEGIEVVFHLACLGVRQSLHEPVRNHTVNASGTLELLEAAHRAQVRRFVYTSSSEVYGSARYVPMDELHPTFPNTVYGGSKLAGEAYVRAYNRTYDFPAVVLRPFNAYGPRSHHEGDSGEVVPKFLVRLMNGLPPVLFGDGSQSRDFTHVDDTAHAIGAAAYADDAIGLTINIGTGTETTIFDLARLIAEVTGQAEVTPVHSEMRPGDVQRLVADPSVATKVLDWSPQIPLRQGLLDLLDWHEAAGTDWSVALREDRVRSWEVQEARMVES